MSKRVVSADAPCSFLEQRLRYARAFIDDPLVFANNAPMWPEGIEHAVGVDPASMRAYAPAQGAPELIDALCRREDAKYGLRVRSCDVLVTNGALHAVALIFRDLFRPGSVALCQAPVYRGIAELLIATGYEIAWFNVNDSEIDLERLRRAHPGIRLVFINTPNNPTGEICSERSFERLLQVAEDHHAALVTDLVYDDFLFVEHKPVCPLALREDWRHLYVVNSLSKNYGVPGLRIGWVVSHLENIGSLTALLEGECIAVNALAQQQAAGLLGQGNEVLVSRVRENRRSVEHYLAQIPGITYAAPAGGTQFFVNLPVDDIEEFADRMLVDHGLVLATSASFAACPANHVRIPLGYPLQMILRSIKTLAMGLGRPPHLLRDAESAEEALVRNRAHVGPHFAK